MRSSPPSLPSTDGLVHLSDDKQTAVVTFDPDPFKNGVFRRTASGWVHVGVWTVQSPQLGGV